MTAIGVADGTIGGEVIYFDAERGVGFATGADGNRYVFDRHDLGAVERVAKGARIEFRPDGDRAREIAVAASRRTAVPVTAGQPAAPAAAFIDPRSRTTGLFGYFRRTLGTNYANFRGRARRKEYWGFVLFSTLLLIAVVTAGFLLGIALGFDEEREPVVTTIAAGVAALALFIPSIAVTVRRQHDIGLSGWFLLLWLIPSIGALIVFVFTLVPTQKHDNKWGPIPDGIRL
jgi:uncharacterized membrane protein YhaH (DUF805 family)